MGVIYKITCTSNNKIYIGQTKHSSNHRWNQHVYEALTPNVKQCRLLNRSISKYGRENFIVEDLMESSDVEELNEWEIFYIEWFDAMNTEVGMNLNSGGRKNHVISEDTRKKLSEAIKGKPKDTSNISRKYPEYNWLPKYLRYYQDQTGITGFKISDHPNIPDTGSQSRCFTSKEKSDLGKNFIKAAATMLELNGLYKSWYRIYKYGMSNDYIYGYFNMSSLYYIFNIYVPENHSYKYGIIIPYEYDRDALIYGHNNEKLPRGVQKMTNGYRFCMPGYPTKSFQSSSLTNEEKKQLAINHRYEVLNKLIDPFAKPKNPKGLQDMKNGYKVVVKGFPIKCFADTALPMDIKYKLAEAQLNYYNSQL